MGLLQIKMKVRFPFLRATIPLLFRAKHPGSSSSNWSTGTLPRQGDGDKGKFLDSRRPDTWQVTTLLTYHRAVLRCRLATMTWEFMGPEWANDYS